MTANNKVSFEDLPLEVADIIFGYLSRAQIEELFDDLFWRKYVVRLLFSSISINDDIESPFFSGEIVRKPINHFNSPVELIKFFKSYPNIKPKRIKFQDYLDAVYLLQNYPNLLKGVQLDIIYKFVGNDLEYNVKLLSELINESFEIEFIFAGKDTYSLHKSFPQKLTMQTKSLLVLDYRSTVTDMNFTDWFPNLTSLVLNRNLTPDKLKFIPKQLKSLDFDLEYLETDDVTLDLPESLEVLWIKIKSNRLLTGIILDISHLINLEDLKIDSTDGIYARLYSFIVPTGLKKLSTFHQNIVGSDIAVLCPGLVEYKLNGGYDSRFGNNLTFPSTLKHLHIPSGYLTFLESANDINDFKKQALESPPIKLPETITELVIEHLYQGALLLDFEFNPLPNLEVLSLDCDDSTVVYIEGKLPRNLTSLSFNYMGTFNFNELSSLDKLEEFCFNSSNETNLEFSPVLPLGFGRLKLQNCNFKKIDLNANRFSSLDLTGTLSKMTQDPNNLILPKELNTLNVSQCELSYITTDSYLQNVKNSNMNMKDDIRLIDNLPYTLKRLDCSENKFGEYNEASKFPVELEYINFDNNKIGFDWLQNSNINKCVNLKILSLQRNNLSSFDPKCLPISLEILVLSMNEISSLVNDFKDFINLEVLDLRSTKLKEYFESSNKIENFSFGKAINKLFIGGNKLSQDTIDKLFEKLCKNKEFDYLDVVGHKSKHLLKLNDQKSTKV